MPDTLRLALPLIVAGQTQKDVTHNAAVQALDRLVALCVASRSQAVPPATPAAGECHIVPAGGVAGWAQPAGTLMHWQGNGWLAEAPRDGLVALLIDEAVMLVHQGGWRSAWPVAGLAIGGRSVLAAVPAAVGLPAGGGVVDTQARAAIADLVIALQQQGIVA